ncbi:uncharacterized protein [Gossypium hirsutum]|uniref:Uncharacterized protein n=1 Tax=Gossypium hirsutum TaxID=3635 RepID=A0ABM3AUR9_GOSHI|nr:uncharacterized protein LOC121222164 [Gossypium hirsutum]
MHRRRGQRPTTKKMGFLALVQLPEGLAFLAPKGRRERISHALLGPTSTTEKDLRQRSRDPLGGLTRVESQRLAISGGGHARRRAALGLGRGRSSALGFTEMFILWTCWARFWLDFGLLGLGLVRFGF